MFGPQKKNKKSIRTAAVKMVLSLQAFIEIHRKQLLVYLGIADILALVCVDTDVLRVLKQSRMETINSELRRIMNCDIGHHMSCSEVHRVIGAMSRHDVRRHIMFSNEGKGSYAQRSQNLNIENRVIWIDKIPSALERLRAVRSLKYTNNGLDAKTLIVQFADSDRMVFGFGKWLMFGVVCLCAHLLNSGQYLSTSAALLALWMCRWTCRLTDTKFTPTSKVPPKLQWWMTAFTVCALSLTSVGFEYWVDCGIALVVMYLILVDLLITTGAMWYIHDDHNSILVLPNHMGDNFRKKKMNRHLDAMCSGGCRGLLQKAGSSSTETFSFYFWKKGDDSSVAMIKD